MWTWGKGDYFRLGHGCDAHVRRPTLVEALRGRRVIHVAVGALHCLAVTSEHQVLHCMLLLLLLADHNHLSDVSIFVPLIINT